MSYLRLPLAVPMFTLLLVAACGGGNAAAPPGSGGGATEESRGAPVGEECVVNSDCATGMCDRTVPGGYCTAHCTTDDECGAGGWCDSDPEVGTGFCYQRCTSQRECRSALFQCYQVVENELGVCSLDLAAVAPTGTNVGAPCSADVECMGPVGTDATCIPAMDLHGSPTGYTGGMCVALGCSEGLSCGDGLVCVPGAVAYCAPACTADGDCRDGYSCDAESGSCVPAGPM